MKSLVPLAVVIIFAIPVSPKPSEAVGVVGAGGSALNSTIHAPAGAEALEATELLNVTIGTEALENSEALNVTAGAETLEATEAVNLTTTSEAPKDHAQHPSLKTTTAAMDSEESDEADDSSDEFPEHHIDHRSVREATTVSDSSESEEEDDEIEMDTVTANLMSSSEVVLKMCKFLRTKITMVKSHAECSMQHPFWARQVRKYDSILASAHNSWLPSDRFGRIVTMPKSQYHDVC